MRQPLIAHLFVLLTTLGVFTSAPGVAHEFEPERQVIVQVFPTHLDVAILYIDTPGARTDLFAFQYGLQHRGNNPLTELSRRAILPRLLDGLQFEVHGESPRAQEPEVRVERRQGRLQAAAFVRYDLDPPETDKARTVTIRALDQPFQATPVLLYAGEGMEILGDEASSARTLRRGEELSLRFGLTESEDGPQSGPGGAPPSEK